MFFCGHCEKICNTYEDGWLRHLVSKEHQVNLGTHDVFVKHNKDPDRNERSLIVWKIHPKTDPFKVVCHFAKAKPLAFVTDVFIHIFPHVTEKFYLIVYDHRKFAQQVASLYHRRGDQKVVTSWTSCTRKSDLTESEWNSKLDQSFFIRRHEYIKRKKLADIDWDNQLDNLLMLTKLHNEGYDHRETIVGELETLLREELPKAKVLPFGSCVTWVAGANADLDVYVHTLDGKDRRELKTEDKLQVMSKTIKVLRSNYDDKNVIPVNHVRVRMVKLKHPSGLNVNFTFENFLSHRNSIMIRRMTELDYRVRPFLNILRYWAKFHNLSGLDSIEKYGLILMALVYLRREKILPSVYEFQSLEGVSKYLACGWNASSCSNQEAPREQLPWLKAQPNFPSEGKGQKIMKLVYGFFKEYAAFDFDNLVICPLTGTHLPKQSFESTLCEDLPCEMGLLKDNLRNNECEPFQVKTKPICVQDPFALNVNVTSSCLSEDIVFQFKAACAAAAEALKPFVTCLGYEGTKNILELCCQPISETKLDVTVGASVHVNNLDHLAYGMATSTAHKDERKVKYDSTTQVAVRKSTRYSDKRQNCNYGANSDRERNRERHGRGENVRHVENRSHYRDDARPYDDSRAWDKRYSDEYQPVHSFLTTFSLLMNDAYRLPFSEITKNLPVPETVKPIEMKVLWAIALRDFFKEENFWNQLSPLYSESSFKTHKLEETEQGFEVAARWQSKLVEQDSHQYTGVNTDRKRKRDVDDNATSGTVGCVTKVMRRDPAVLFENEAWEYENKAEQTGKEAKISENLRRSCTTAYYFECRPKNMDILFTLWGKLLQASLVKNAFRDPLELLGQIIRSHIMKPVPISVFPRLPDDRILAMRLLVAIDTNSEIPEIKFGYETGIPQDHPNWKLQEQFYENFRYFLQGILRLYLNHRLVKYLELKSQTHGLVLYVDNEKEDQQTEKTVAGESNMA